MNLDLDVQLQVALRALEDTVAPALGAAEGHVLEQFHLALMTLRFVKTRLPDMRRFARMELAAYATLARASISAAGAAPELAAAVADGLAIQDDATADTAAIVSATRRLRDEITALGSQCEDLDIRAELDRLVLEQGGAMIGQARQWASPYGFELKPEALPAPAW
jgi:hypothetical protein